MLSQLHLLRINYEQDKSIKRGSPLFIEIAIVHHSWCFVHAIKAKATIYVVVASIY